MAKIFGSQDLSTIPAKLLALFIPVATKSGQTFRKNGGKAPIPNYLVEDFSAKRAAAYTAWHNLKPWKKARWNLCGITHGTTGFRLYVRLHVKYNLTGTRQPISPCSRRVLDPASSPFDFTP